MYNAIKQMLVDGGKCLLIENGEPIGVVLTTDEYEKLLAPKTNLPPQTPPYKGGDKGEVIPANPTNLIGEAMSQEMDYTGISADLADIQAVDDVTLEDLGIDEMTSID